MNGAKATQPTKGTQGTRNIKTTGSSRSGVRSPRDQRTSNAQSPTPGSFPKHCRR